MANLEVPEKPQFSTEVTKLEATTPAHANVFNEINQQLFTNEIYLENKKADKTTQHPVSLLASNWIGESTPYSYILELPEITKDNNITLIPSQDITTEQYTSLLSAQIENATQTIGSITLQAKGSKPMTNIPILILIGDSNVQISGGGATVPLINHLLTENAGVGALDAVQGKVLNDKLENHEKTMNSSMQTTYISSKGWYRFALYEHYDTTIVMGSLCNGVEMTLKRTYIHTNNEIHKCSLLAVYGGSRIAELYGACNTNIIKKIRHVVDQSNHKAYLDLFYDSNDMDGISIQLDSIKDVEKNAWKAIPMTQVQEVVEGEQIYSTLEFSVNATPAMKEIKAGEISFENNISGTNVCCKKTSNVINIGMTCCLKSGNFNANTTYKLCTLPDRFRPNIRLENICSANDGTQSSRNIAHYEIKPDGTIYFDMPVGKKYISFNITFIA